MQTARHKFYLADEAGVYNGHDRLKVYVSGAGLLHIGNRLLVPVSDVESCEVTPAPGTGEGRLITIVIRSPKLNRGERTPVYLIHVDFWTRTRLEPMRAFVEELRPLIGGERLDDKTVEEILRPPPPAGDGTFEVWYCLNLSILIGYYHKTWFSYDSRRQAVLRTWILLLLGALNIAGVLIFVLPHYNWLMTRNLRRVGCGRAHRVIAYVVSLALPCGWWVFVITCEVMKS